MPVNGRIFAIGDIHGCLDKLARLTQRIDASRNDTIIFLGDYIDRGPDSAGVIEFLLNFREKSPSNIIFLKGNHEVMLLDYLSGRNQESYLYYGGVDTSDSYSARYGKFSIPEEHLAFLKGLESFYQTEKYFFVHAGLKPGVPILEQRDSDRLWIRWEFVKSDYDWGKRVIFGHTPFIVPRIEPNKIGIDTGAVYGRDLTCLVLPEVDFIFA